MSVESQYRAVICGEEHIVKGWRDGNLLTDKGEFVLRQLYADYPIQSARIVEVASLQFQENGEWLINGHNLGSLQLTPAGCRLTSITGDEPPRVYKGEIHAVAWVQRANSERVTELLDTIRDSWKTVTQPVKEYANDHELYRDLGRGISNIGLTLYYTKLFSELLSAPIWLTEFHQVGVVVDERTKEQIRLAVELKQTQTKLRKTQAVANNTLKEALSHWMRFGPVGMKADTQARIEKAVKMYLTDLEKRSLRKIANEFKVSRTTIWKWFAKFTEETGFPVVTHERHESVLAHSKADSEQDVEG